MEDNLTAQSGELEKAELPDEKREAIYKEMEQNYLSFLNKNKDNVPTIINMSKRNKIPFFDVLGTNLIIIFTQ